MIPYIIIAAGLGLLLTMIMNLRLAKRQQGVQTSLVEVASAHGDQLTAVQREAGEARTAAQVARQEVAASAKAQEPVVNEVRARVDGVEQRFGKFEIELENAAKRSLAASENLIRQGGETTAKEIEGLRHEAKSLGAEVRAVREDSERQSEQFAELSQRLGSIEGSLQSLGLGGKQSKKATTPVRQPTAHKQPATRQAGARAKAKPGATHDVVASMAAPTLATSGAHREPEVNMPSGSGSAAAHFDTEAEGEIDEGSARWIFVVLGLMLALAVAANIAST